MAELTSLRNIGIKTHICLVHLYTLQGAIDNIEYNQLSDDVKRDLKSFSDDLKCAFSAM